MQLEPNMLMASMFWGTIGTGFVIYGKKQGATVPLVAGLTLVAISYFIASPLWLSVASCALLSGAYWASKQGW